MIHAILCDLGNVLLRFDHMKACQGFSTLSGLDAETVHKKVFGSGLEEAFDLGRVSSAEFARQLEKALGIHADPETLRKIWADIFHEMPGMAPLIQSLAARYRLVLLSNTNPWHFEHCLERFPWLNAFHAFALSYKLGLKKPDPALFDQALSLAKAAPDEAVFIDDIRDYVSGARALGVKSICFKDADQLKSEFRAQGIAFSA